MTRMIVALALLCLASPAVANEQTEATSFDSVQLVVSQQPLSHRHEFRSVPTPMKSESSRRDVLASLNPKQQTLLANEPNPSGDRKASSDGPSRSTSGVERSSHTVIDSMFDSLRELPPPANALPMAEDTRMASAAPSAEGSSALMPAWESWTSPQRIVGSVRVVAIMAALSLAPALLLMTTCYIRLVVVLGLLRHALGSQQLPPQQVTTTLAMFLTVLIMWPVWSQVHRDAIEPYSDPEIAMSAEEAWSNGQKPIRDFMIGQIQRAGNGPDVAMFLDYLDISQVTTNAEIPLQALLPAFLISELKVAFLIGFQIYLPFVLLDLVVSSVTMSMGMVMVPPTTISLPLKLIMFVLVDGWHLVVEMLLMSFSSA